MGQQAAYASINIAMKVLKEKKPEQLYRTLTEEVTGEMRRKVLNEKKVLKMKASTRKSWSIRCLRWMEHMPEALINKDVKLKGTKKELKEWIRKSIPVKGDRILWGQKLTGETRRKRKRNPARQDNDDGSGQEEEPAAEEEESREEDQLHNAIEVDNEEREIEEEESRGTNQQDMILKMKLTKKCRIYWRDQERRMKSQERGKRTWRGRRGTESPPREGVEPPHLGEGGSLLPEFVQGTSSGEPLILRGNNPLILTSCMATDPRLPAQQIGGESKQETWWCQWLGVRWRNIRKMNTWPRSGVG